MSNRIKVITALLALYVAGAFLPIGREREKPPPRAPAAAQALAAELPAPIPAVPRKPRPSPGTTQPRPQLVSDHAAHEVRSLDATESHQIVVESDDALRPDNFVALQQQWERESDDPMSSQAQRAELTSLFEELQLPSELIRDVRCRRSVCRIAVDASNPLQLAGLASRAQEGEAPVSFRMQDGQAFAYVPSS